MLGNEEHQLNSPITPLSFDFKKKRSKARSNSPDILKRSSPDLVQRPKKSLHSQEDVRGSDFSSSDYAPVSTEGWIITDNRQRKYSQSTFTVKSKMLFSSRASASAKTKANKWSVSFTLPKSRQQTFRRSSKRRTFAKLFQKRSQQKTQLHASG